jgi:16S rRNA (uracil1498-N3)-methyltransferase
MRISRLYLPAEYQENQSLVLSKQQAHYIITVLRLKNGTELEIFNGRGQVARGLLKVISRREAEIELKTISESSTESPLQTILLQGISRGDRMDHSIQKAVELGVSAIQPLFTERCEVKLKGDKLEKRRQQWQSIVINACEQSGRTLVPEIMPLQSLTAWLENQTEKPFGLVLDPYANQTIAELPKPDNQEQIYILIGPEGGLSNSEVEQAVAKGFNSVKLGPRILRTETAGPAVIAILQTLWGDI